MSAGPSTSSSSSSSDRLPSNNHQLRVYGGIESERKALNARLARVLKKSPSLQQECLGVVILGDSLTAPGKAASSAPLAQAFLDFPLVSGSLLTVFNLSEKDRLKLVASQGEDVVDVSFAGLCP